MRSSRPRRHRRRRREEPGSSEDWEQVWNGESETIASIVAGRLEAEGIRTRLVGSLSPYRTVTLALAGSWAIMVPATSAAAARQHLRNNNEGQNVIDEEPEGGLTMNQRAMLFFAVVFALAVTGWVIVAQVMG